ncbi:hypothetical protein [Streptomyces hebeiensis]
MDEAVAEPAEEAWRMDTYDPGADCWTPGLPMRDRAKVARRLERLAEEHPTWADGQPVQRWLVRVTTTYMVVSVAGEAPPQHVGNRVNAEDCPACCASEVPPPYPWICPGEPGSETDGEEQ